MNRYVYDSIYIRGSFRTIH